MGVSTRAGHIGRRTQLGGERRGRGRRHAGSHTLMLTGLTATGTDSRISARKHTQLPTSQCRGAGFVLAAAFVITRFPDRWAMLPDPTTGLDQPAKLRWAATIVIGLAIFVYTGRDPGRARVRSGPAQNEPSQASPTRRL